MQKHQNETGRREMSGAEMVVQALKDNGVAHIFGYPGGAVLRSTTSCSSRRRSSTSSCGMSRAPATRPKAMPVRRESAA